MQNFFLKFANYFIVDFAIYMIYYYRKIGWIACD